MRKTFTSSVYLANEKAVLLIYHKRFNTWVPVGGEIEANESPTDGARREVEEETGIKDILFFNREMMLSIPGLVTYEEHDAGSKGWHMNFVFFAYTASREVPKPCDEFTEYRWFTGKEPELRSAPENVQVLVRFALLRMIR